MKYTKAMVGTLLFIGLVFGCVSLTLAQGFTAVCWCQLREDSAAEVVCRQPEWSKHQSGPH